MRKEETPGTETSGTETPGTETSGTKTPGTAKLQVTKKKRACITYYAWVYKYVIIHKKYHDIVIVSLNVALYLCIVYL